MIFFRDKKIIFDIFSNYFFISAVEITGIEPVSHAVTGRHPSPVDLTSNISGESGTRTHTPN